MTLPANILKDLKDVSDDLIGNTIGVRMATDLLLKDLEQLSRHLGERNYEAAAQLGYESLASNFVFLQRCLGGLQTGCNDRDAIIQAIVQEYHTSFETEQPEAYSVMAAMRPKP